MPMYRKKPVEVEARQLHFSYDDATREYDHGNLDEIQDWIWSNKGSSIIEYDSSGDFGIVILTLEGDMLANSGDWIIKGVKGEFYPCKPDIFEQTYEAVND